jgi:transcriptional regulator with XRE-family HTH domain
MLNEKIRRARKESKLTQTEVAEMLKINIKRYAAWEEGRCNPPPQHLYKLSMLLKTTTDSLLSPKETIHQSEQSSALQLLYHQATPQVQKIVMLILKSQL